MDRREVERLAAYIRREGSATVEVLGIEPLGQGFMFGWPAEYYVNCVYKGSTLVFVVRSFDDWESRKNPSPWLRM